MSLGQFLNTPTRHAMHHDKVGAEFGLYLNDWDYEFGSDQPDIGRRVAATMGSA